MTVSIKKILLRMKNAPNCCDANEKRPPNGVVFLRTQRQLYSPAASYIATQWYSACAE